MKTTNTELAEKNKTLQAHVKNLKRELAEKAKEIESIKKEKSMWIESCIIKQREIDEIKKKWIYKIFGK